MNPAQWWRRFWTASYVPRNDLYVTRLKASAPTVTPEEVAKLERKRNPLADWARDGNGSPIDYEDLPVG